MKTFATTRRPASLRSPVRRASLPLRGAAESAVVRNVLHGPRLQPKLTVGPPGDAYEREADRVADAVMRMPEPGAGASSVPPRMQRLCAECEEKKREEEVQAKAEPGKTLEVPDGFAQRLAALHGSGQPLPAAEPEKIQRAQIDHVHPGTGSGADYFLYELDSTISTFSQLASHYGVSRTAISLLNPGARATALHAGDQIKVPAIDAPSGSGPMGPPLPSIIHSTATRGIDLRWSSTPSSNRIGDLSRGTAVGEISGGVKVARSDIQHEATGVVDELIYLGLADTTSVFGFVASTNLRLTLTPVSSSDVDLIARMIWGEQRSQGADAMEAAAWVARNRFEAGWGSYAQIITRGQFHGLASPSAVRGLTGADLTRWADAQTIAQEVIDGTRADPTGGAPYFGNGPDVLRKMRTCARSNPSFVWGTISGTNFHYSNGDYTSAGCTVP